jgi:hypothetical protein
LNVSPYFLFTSVSDLTISVSDSEIIPSAPATVSRHRDSAENKQKETSEKKRKEPLATTAPETTVITKSIKVEGSGSRGRVRAADFNELTRSIIEETISIYRAQIASVEHFPERADDRDIVKQAWLEVCTGRNLRVELEEDIYKFVSDSRLFHLFVTMMSPCRLSHVLRKQEDMLKQHLGHISYLHSRLTA